MPIEVELEGQNKQISKQKRRQKVIEKSDWSEEEIKNYRDCCGGWTCEQRTKSKGIKAESKVHKVQEENKNMEVRKKEWHSKKWKREKRFLRKMLRRWKKRKISQQKYVKKKELEDMM